MREHKLPEFNPLDLLATAASLQCPGRETTTDNSPVSPPPSVDNSSEDNSAMRKERCSRRTRTTCNQNNGVDNTKIKNKKLENDLKIYKVVVKNELSKMLEEHNYGHPKRNFRYILHDEPFSSEDKETDLKLMDSNCNECRDNVEGSPQEETLVTPDTSCDDNCSRLSLEESSQSQETVNNELNTAEFVASSENSSVESGVADMSIDSSSCADDVSDKDLPGLTSLEVLEQVSECSGSVLVSPTVSEGEEKEALQPIESFGEIRQVDRIDSCDDEQTLVDIETVSADSNTAENIFPERVVNTDQTDTSNTLDGFIVSDPCHSCNSVNDIEKTSELKDFNSVVTPREKTVAPVSERNLPTPVVTGNIKKQTIIRSLLTGETIVVVQKSQNGSKELGKIPILVDSTQAQRGKGSERLLSDVQKDKPETLLAHLTSPVHSRLVQDNYVEAIDTSEKTNHRLCDKKNLTETSDNEIARQQNRINSEILAGKDIPSVGVGTMVVSPDKQLASPLSVATIAVNPANVEKLGLQVSAVHSSLLSKLSNGISQRKAQAAGPVMVPHSSLERFNIGQFASVSSSKIGLVKVNKNIPKSLASAADNGKKGPGKIKPFDNAAYQQVIKKFPNLVKAYRDDDLLKMAVSPDDVLQCVVATTKSRSSTDSHISHDHDYCLKSPPVGSLPPMLLADGRLIGDVDREPKLGRPPKNGERRKKPARKTVDGAGSRTASPSMDTASSEAKQHPELKLDMEMKRASNKRRFSRQKYGRDSSPGEGIESPEIDGQGDGAKIKITGAFQDDFVYFINKTSRNRRRASEQPTLPLAPVIQASDIYIPHLSDADIAALKKKTALNSGVSNSNTGEVHMNDEDSKVINTILSMENSLHKDSFGDPLNGFDLTPEQMDILYSAIDEANTDPSVGKFNEASKPEPDSPGELHVPTSAGDGGDISAKARSDSSSQLLGNVDNIQMSNMDLILNDAPSMKTYLPTLDVSEVQDSISAISTSSTTLITGLTTGSVPTSVSGDVPTSQISQIDRKPSPENDMPSFEKSLDFLEVGDMKTDLFSEGALLEVNSAPVPTPSSEANAPWIVTVSMFWNDLPAIMLDNLPYVRLVDIYKQILPAKDTGILKKRCQLLGVEVRNCSEMQRYFLVKYGRGYNSKSTLVVSKDDAMRLIAFYVEPQSRPVVGKVTVGKMTGSPMAAPKLQKPIAVSDSSCDSTNSGNVSPSVVSDSSLPASDQPTVSIKKEKPRSSNPRSPSKRRQVIADGESVSKRLRHKKINFRNMVQGIKREDEVKEGESPIPSTSPTDVDTAVVPEGSNVEQTQTVEVNKELVIHQIVEPQTDESNAVQPQHLKPRSYNRANVKVCRPHSYGLPRPLRSFNVLGRQFRRVKGNFHNGSLHNVLKKRQLNVAVQKSATNSELKNKLESEAVESVKQMAVAGLQEELPLIEDSEAPVTARRASPRRQGIPPIVASDRVRSSGRKRKLKQLYPIENYSFSKKPRKGVPVDLPSLPAEPVLHASSRPRTAAAPVRTSPRKKRAETTSQLDSDDSMVLSPRSTSEDEENRPKNVITLANGPEFETFTALVGDFNV